MKLGFTTFGKVLSACLSLALLSSYVWWRQDVARKEQARLDALNVAQEKAIATQRENQESDAREGLEFTGPMVRDVIMPSPKVGHVVLPSSKSGPAIDLDKLLEQNPELRKQLEEKAEEAEEQMPKDEEGNPLSPARDRALIPSSKSTDRGLTPREPGDDK